MAKIRFNPCSPCCKRPVDFAVMVFIDESYPVYVGQNEPTATGTTYLDHVAEFNAFMELHKEKGVFLAIVQVEPVGLDGYFIKPEDTPLPDYFSGIYNLERDPTESEPFQAIWNDFVGNSRPKRAAMVVDNSGSMYTGTLGSGFVLFQSWLESQYPEINLSVNPFGAEDWVYQTQQILTGMFNAEEN